MVVSTSTKFKVQARSARSTGKLAYRRGRTRLGLARRALLGQDLSHPIDSITYDEEPPTWTLDDRCEFQHLPNTATGSEVAAALAKAGGVVIDNLVEPEVMDRVMVDMQPWIDANDAGDSDFKGHNTKRTGALVVRSETARELLQHPTVLATVNEMLGHASAYRVHLTQVISIGPGEPAQKIHRDHWIFNDFPFPPGYEVQCNTIWALTDFTEENGATRVVPGSNHAGNRLNFKHRDSVPATMTKGSVLLYTGSVYHGGGANTSDSTRHALNLTYSLGWLRQEENQYLAVPRELARTLPVDLLKLLGYQLGAGLLGYVGDVKDPLDSLELDR